MGTERRFCEMFTDSSTGGLLAGQQDQAASYTGPYHQTSADKHQSTYGRCWHNLPGFTCATSAEMMIAEVCAPEALHCCKTEGARECIELRDHRSQIWYHTLPVEPFKIFGKICTCPRNHASRAPQLISYPVQEVSDSPDSRKGCLPTVPHSCEIGHTL